MEYTRPLEKMLHEFALRLKSQFAETITRDASGFKKQVIRLIRRELRARPGRPNHPPARRSRPNVTARKITQRRASVSDSEFSMNWIRMVATWRKRDYAPLSGGDESVADPTADTRLALCPFAENRMKPANNSEDFTAISVASPDSNPTLSTIFSAFVSRLSGSFSKFRHIHSYTWNGVCVSVSSGNEDLSSACNSVTNC